MSPDGAHRPWTERLVMMANQIGRFFAHRGEAKAVPAIADHLKKFWDPRMRSAIVAHVAAGGGGLDPFALKAVQYLAQERQAPQADVSCPVGVIPDSAKR
jgi:formate dehydrogenase subunit delta